MDNRTPNGAWTRSQLEAIGVPWPPARGWIKTVLGKTIDQSDAHRFEQKISTVM